MAAVGATALMGGGTLYLVSLMCPGTSPCDDSETMRSYAGPAALAGLVLVLTGVVLHGADQHKRRAGVAAELAAERRYLADERARAAADVRRRREVGRRLVVQARLAAEAGDCATVKKLDPQLRAVDRQAHWTQFAADPVIRRCLQP